MPRVARRSWLHAHMARTRMQSSRSRSPAVANVMHVSIHPFRRAVKVTCETAQVTQPPQHAPPGAPAARELTAEVINVRWSDPAGDFAVLDAICDDGEEIV